MYFVTFVCIDKTFIFHAILLPIENCMYTSPLLFSFLPPLILPLVVNFYAGAQIDFPFQSKKETYLLLKKLISKKQRFFFFFFRIWKYKKKKMKISNQQGSESGAGAGAGAGAGRGRLKSWVDADARCAPCVAQSFGFSLS